MGSLGDTLEAPASTAPGELHDPGLGSSAHVAVVDLGSNSIRLVVYDSLSRAPFPRFNEKSLCRLGARIDADGNLAEGAMDCVARALERFVAIARAMEVERIDLLATEAIRQATNGDAFRERLESLSGLSLSVVDGDEEARLAALGVVAGFHRPEGLVGDLGGGSLEIAEVRGDAVGERRHSMPIGSLKIRERMQDDPRAAKDHVDEALRAAMPKVVTGPDFYVVGGSWRALAKIHLAENPQPVPVVHGLCLEPDVLRDLAKRLWRMDEKEIANVKGVPGRRIPVLPAAALVMDRVLKHLKPGRVHFSALGVREGWLFDQLSEDARRADPLLTGCRLLAVEHARVPRFAEALERWTDNLFIGESGDQRRLRHAAIALSDIAWRERSDVQASHAFERILRFPFLGVTARERMFLAAVVRARYGKPGDKDMLSLLDDEEIARAHVLGAALVLGYRFSGSVNEILDRAKIELDAKQVTLAVDRRANVPDGDAVQTRLSELAKALGRDKTAVVEHD